MRMRENEQRRLTKRRGVVGSGSLDRMPSRISCFRVCDLFPHLCLSGLARPSKDIGACPALWWCQPVYNKHFRSVLASQRLCVLLFA